MLQCFFVLLCGSKQALQQTAPGLKSPPPADHKVAPKAEQKVASNVEVKTTPAVGIDQTVEVKADSSSLPKCIGPGCENDAQPDSVYCGNVCILKHAAAAMKSITDVKEPKEKAGAKSTAKVTRDRFRRSAFLPKVLHFIGVKLLKLCFCLIVQVIN